MYKLVTIIIELMELFKKILRYLLMFLLAFIGTKYIAADKLNNYDILSIVMFITICFAFIDMYIPVVCYE